MPRVASSGDFLETPLHAMDGDLLGLRQKLWLEESRTELQQLLPSFPCPEHAGDFPAATAPGAEACAHSASISSRALGGTCTHPAPSPGAGSWL